MSEGSDVEMKPSQLLEELDDDIGASDLWDEAPDPESVTPVNFPRRVDDYVWSIHFAERTVEDPRPPTPETVDEVLSDGTFDGQTGRHGYRFEKDYDGVVIRVVVAFTEEPPVRGILVTAYPIVQSLTGAADCDRFDPEEIRRSYAESYLKGAEGYEFEDGGTVPDDWKFVDFERPVTVNGHKIIGRRGRPYPRCENCHRRLNHGQAQQQCPAGGDLE